MKSNKKSILMIKNAYCCGHGDIVNRLKNYLVSAGIKYVEEKVYDNCVAIYNDHTVELSPNTSLNQIISSLGLTQSSH